MTLIPTPHALWLQVINVITQRERQTHTRTHTHTHTHISPTHTFALYASHPLSHTYTACTATVTNASPCPRERVCCLLALNSVTSTPQWIRQPKPRDGVYDVCVFVCKCVLRSSRASQPLNILAYAFSSTSASSFRLMPLRLAVSAASAFQAPPLLHSRPSPPPNGVILLTYPLHLGLLPTCNSNLCSTCHLA